MNIKIGVGNIKHGTKINEIEVPERMRKKIPTGIGFIDDCYGGKGLTPGTITLFTGTPGAGKSTLLLQIAQAIASHQVGRDPCFALVNTTEESLFQTKMVSERLFGENSGSFYVGEDHIISDKGKADGGPNHENVQKNIESGNLRSILQHMKSLQKKHPGEQGFLLIDSLQAIDDGFYPDGHTNSATPVRSISLLTNFCKETYTIGIVIGQVNKSGEFAGKQAIKHMIDCHMHLKIDTRDKSETQGMRIFEMEKNRYGYSGQAYILNVESNGLYEFGALNQD